jgi:hypothetical protein
MAHSALEQVLEIIRDLNVNDLRQVEQAVQERLRPAGEAAARDACHRALVAAGLVKRIKAPPTRKTVEPPLVPIQGKPLSETIIEERR